MRIKFTGFVFLLCCLPTVVFAETLARWGYTGDIGPEHWGEITSNFQLCKNGKQQSPIDISGEQTTQSVKAKFNYLATPLEVTNNTHAIEIDYEQGANLVIGGDSSYQLTKIQFHSPSEHTLNGQHYAMEAQLIHENSNNKVVIVSVLMKLGELNSTLNKIIDAAPVDEAINFVPGEFINANDLLPAFTDRFYTYSGSMTAPPCTENVTWMVMDETITVGQKQVDKFVNVLSENSRPTQPIKSHNVLVSHAD